MKICELTWILFIKETLETNKYFEFRSLKSPGVEVELFASVYTVRSSYFHHGLSLLVHVKSLWSFIMESNFCPWLKSLDARFLFSICEKG